MSVRITESTQKPDVVPFFDEDTNTYSYVVRDPSSASCAVIDAVLNFDYASGTLAHIGADAIISYIKEHDLVLEWLIETHVHADHLSAAPYIQEHLGGKVGIGEYIAIVQDTFGNVFNEGAEFKRDGSDFDYLFSDEQTYKIGSLTGVAIYTPGAPPACMTHVIGDAAFVGDTLFMPDAGTARADFPGGNAEVLYDSIQKIYQLPEDTRLFMCHDYGPDGRDFACQTTVKEQIANNIHAKETIDKGEFVRMRNARDQTLDMPFLILPSLQVNMRAGHFPDPESNNTVYLKIPVNAFSKNA